MNKFWEEKYDKTIGCSMLNVRNRRGAGRRGGGREVNDARKEEGANIGRGVGRIY